MFGLFLEMITGMSIYFRTKFRLGASFNFNMLDLFGNLVPTD
jgi:hypothetical protein